MSVMQRLLAGVLILGSVPIAYARQAATQPAAQPHSAGGQTASQPATRPHSQDEPKLRLIAARHIVVAYEGALNPQGDAKRSKEAARKFAEELAAKVRAGEDIGALAKQHSSDPLAPFGGIVVAQQGQMLREWEDAALALKVGEVSDSVETSFGYHVIKRESPEDVAGRAQRILIQYVGATRASRGVARGKEEAAKLAEELAKKLKAGSDAAELAREYTDDAALKLRGGDGGVMIRGKMAPAFDKALFELKVGEVSDVIETEYGYFIMKKIPLDTPLPSLMGKGLRGRSPAGPGTATRPSHGGDRGGRPAPQPPHAPPSTQPAPKP